MKLVTVVVPTLLVVSLLSGCIGVSQEKYNTVMTDLAKAEANLILLQADLEGERFRIKEIQSQLEAQEAEISRLQGQLEVKDVETTRLQTQLEVNATETNKLQNQLSKTEAETIKLQTQLETYGTKVAELEKQLQLLKTQVPEYELLANRTVNDCVEPMNVVVRNQAVSIVSDAPSGIDTNSEEWKIWQINYWVANNINYISDPKGHEYLAYAHETLETKAGDCDDFAILLSSMYETVGLDAAIASIDTDDDGEKDHMTALVYYTEDSDSFIDEEQIILDKMRLSIPTGKIRIRFWNAGTSHPVLGKYESGLWIIADPPMDHVKGMVGYITHLPYKAIKIFDVGN